MNKKGQTIEIIAFIVIGIVAVLLFGGLIYGVGLVNTAMSSTELDTSMVNISAASAVTFAPLHTGMLNLKVVAIVMIVGYILASFIVAYFSAKNPIWIIVYILMAIIVTIFSIYVSNAYESLKETEIVSTLVSNFSASDFVILHLPVFVVIISFACIMLSIVGLMASRRILEQ
jgi:hypothetical protein